MNRQGSDKEMEAIRLMIHDRLQTYAQAKIPEVHPDDDTLCAFVEGRLQEAAATTMVSHLIECGLCRRITAQFSRADFPFESTAALPPEESSGRLESFFGTLASGVGSVTDEDAVFAYQNPPELDADSGEACEPPDSVAPSSSTKDTEPE